MSKSIPKGKTVTAVDVLAENDADSSGFNDSDLQLAVFLRQGLGWESDRVSSVLGATKIKALEKYASIMSGDDEHLKTRITQVYGSGAQAINKMTQFLAQTENRFAEEALMRELFPNSKQLSKITESAVEVEEVDE